MESIWGFIFTIAMIVLGVVSSASKAKKKREEETRRAADAARRAAEARHSAEFEDPARRDAAYRSFGADSRDDFGTGSGADYAGAGSRDGSVAGSAGAGFGMEEEAKSTGGTFGRMLEELSRQLSEQPSPTVVTRPLSKPLTSTARPASTVRPESAGMPASTVRPGMSASSVPRPMASSQPTATSYDYRSLEEDYSGVEGGYGLEDLDAESYYTAGEGRVESGTSAHRRPSGKHGRSAALETVAKGSVKSQADAPEAGDVDVNGTGLVEGTHLRDILGGDFDLRRAIIEAEILTPKYVQ